jgi:hypothetical protein
MWGFVETSGRLVPVLRQFNGVKVFSATLFQDRGRLGDRITDWLTAHPDAAIADLVVTQSSDASFHCIAITLFYRTP